MYFPARGRHLLVYCDGSGARAMQDIVRQGHDVPGLFAKALRDALPPATAATLAQEVIGSGWEFWEQGISFWKQVLKLVPGDSWMLGPQLYYCSEICTDHLGWVEGAIASGQHAAQRIAQQALAA